jgi:hypothetical protein
MLFSKFQNSVHLKLQHKNKCCNRIKTCMGHTFYIAAVTAKKPTHIVFTYENGTVKVLSGPSTYEKIADELREQCRESEFIRDLPEGLNTIQHDGERIQLEPIKSWHYVPFDMLVSMDRRIEA